MSPKNYKVVHEAADRFHVHDGECQFAVAKKGLSPALVKRIQGFAKGGEVVGAADGGELTQEDALVQPGYPTNTPGGSTWWDKTKDFAGNVAQTGLDINKDLGRAMVAGPLMINNALSDPNVRALAPEGFGQSIGQGINQIGHALLPNLVAEQKPGAPGEKKEAFAARQPPPTAERLPGAGAPAGGGGGGPGRQSTYDQRQNAAGEAEKQGLEMQANAEIGKASQQGEVLKAQDLALADQATQRHQMDADHKAYMDKEIGDYKALQQKFSRTEIDPGRFWASRTTGDKMLAGIGMMFGGISAAFGGQSQSMDIINGAISRDIDAQKANLDKTGKAVGMQQNLLGIMREKYKDESTAQAATEATMLQRAKVQLEEVAARAAGPEAQAKLAVLRPQLDAALNEKNATMGLKFQGAADAHALDQAKIRHLSAPGANPAQVGMEAISKLEARFRAGHFTSPLEYENARKNAALQLATAQNGGKLPRPASVKMIEDTLPSWYQMTDAGAHEKFQNARTTVRLGAKAPAGGGGGDSGGEEDLES